MSHFVVTVIGNNPEEQLVRFRIYEATGKIDQYVKDIDITDKVLKSVSTGMIVKDAINQYGINSIISDESMLGKIGKYKLGYAIVQNGKIVKVVKRTNPNGKWDECRLGCNMPGFFSLKPGCHGILGEESISELEKKGEEIRDDIADQALKKEIDFEKTRNRFGKVAQKKYEKLEALFGGTVPQLRYLWDDPIFSTMSIDEKSDFYHDQEAMRIVDKARELHPAVLDIFFDIENFQGTKDEFIRRERGN